MKTGSISLGWGLRFCISNCFLVKLSVLVYRPNFIKFSFMF